jgi:S-adenosylmethionine:tRNA ribosyltransferase-isomerase
VDPRNISISDHDYVLPQDRIAQRPLEQRDASRLLLYKDGIISDHHFRELQALLPADSLVVLNNTRVVNARIIMHRASGGRVEVFCLEPADGRSLEEALAGAGQAEWNCIIGNAKRFRPGEVLHLSYEGITLSAERTGEETVRFQWKPEDRAFASILEIFGRVPLPPYMQREATEPDRVRYNTVFARHEGSVAAPTASLHMTPQLLEGLRKKGVRLAEVTLHVGAGTFLPVKSDRMEGHDMHREQVRVPSVAIQQVVEQIRSRAPVVAMGTTALRTLESLYWHGVAIMEGRAGAEMSTGQWEPYDRGALPGPTAALDAILEQMTSAGTSQCTGSTRLLIAPGYEFQVADALITNFHQPRSTLLLLVAAFIGEDWRRVYAHALAGDYRFLSYGDGSLLFRKP